MTRLRKISWPKADQMVSTPNGSIWLSPLRSSSYSVRYWLNRMRFLKTKDINNATEQQRLCYASLTIQISSEG
ncbi:hypothetical protein D3C80_1791080 [compost metagenome]